MQESFLQRLPVWHLTLVARLRCSRHWSVSSSASITREKLRRHLPRFRYRQHLWFDYRFTVWRILCDFLRDFRPADSVTGAFYDHSPARAEKKLREAHI